MHSIGIVAVLLLLGFNVNSIKISSPFNVTTTDQSNQPDGNCLRCMCNDFVGSQCDLAEVCLDLGSGNCDLLGFSYEYWTEAGKLLATAADGDSELAFMKCRQDIDCSTRTVVAYLAGKVTDCNADGTIDCLDYAAAYFYGPNRCDEHRLQGRRKNRFNACLCLGEECTAEREQRQWRLAGNAPSGTYTAKSTNVVPQQDAVV